jgi:hypothetical protein
MGISIAYSGKLRAPALVPEFVRDLKAWAEAVGWPCKTMTELVAEKLVTCAGLEGITLYPHPECEPLHFHFDREGTFVNHTYCTLLEDTESAAMMRQALAESAALTRRLNAAAQNKAGRDGREEGGGIGLQVSIGIPGLTEAPGKEFLERGLLYNWTKTQFAGAKVHVAVCAILHLVKQRYAPELEVTDDSGYFVDEDYQKLETQLAYVGYLASVASQAVVAAAAPGAGPMTLDAFVQRIKAELAEANNKLH